MIASSSVNISGSSTAKSTVRPLAKSGRWSHLNISACKLTACALKVLFQLDSGLMVWVSDLSEWGSKPKLNDGCFFSWVSFFFLPLQRALSQCEDMFNVKIMEDGCSQMKGHFWLILFSPRMFHFLKCQKRKKRFYFCSSLTLLRLDCKISFPNKIVENYF